jgi:RNA recognition motif-containing protein
MASVCATAAWVSNLPAAWGDREIRSLFEEYGTIQRIDFPESATLVRKPYAYVHFATAGQCEAAIAGLNRQAVNGRSLVVRYGLQPRAQCPPRVPPARQPPAGYRGDPLLRDPFNRYPSSNGSRYEHG